MGIIGSGNIVENFISAAAKIDGTDIVALCTRDKGGDRAKFLLEKYSISNVYDDLDNMLASPDINFVYVASPNSLHYQQSLKALLAGKNVVCEKPFTTTAAEARRLVDTARKNGLMIFEAITTIHLPNFQIIKENLHKIGPIRVANLNFSRFSAKYGAYLRGEAANVFNPAFCGGCLQDINIYNVHFMMALFGAPTSYQYFPSLLENGIDASGVLVMQYPGFAASLTASKQAGGENFAHLLGENGRISVVGTTNCCEIVEMDVKDAAFQRLNGQHEKNQLFYEIRVFKAIFDGGDFEKCYELAEYSVQVMGVLEGARKSAGIIFPMDEKN